MRANVTCDQDTDHKVRVKRDAVIQTLQNATPAQIDNWIEANVNSLAEAKTVLKAMAKVIALLARKL